MDAREELAIVINRSFYGMQAGDFEGYTPDFNAGDDQLAFDILAAGYRKMPSRDEVADQIMLNAIYQGREGSAMTDASRDDHEYMYAQNAADAILALMDGTE